MNYFEAEKRIETTEKTYASPDFYRMLFSDSIALGLRDDGSRILMDIGNHGTQEAQALCKDSLNSGYLYIDKTIPDHEILKVANIKKVSGVPGAFFSHIAMQIAYPQLYWKYFDGEHIWDYYSPKMQDLIELSIACIIDTENTNDYYGIHPTGDSKDAPNKHNEWVVACQRHKLNISEKWQAYLTAKDTGATQTRDIEHKATEDVRGVNLQLQQIEDEKTEKLNLIKASVDEAKKIHTLAKSTPKPLKQDFNA